MSKIRVRELSLESSESERDVLLVAQRMRKTLVDVVGEKKGSSLYSIETLIERVRWHLDAAQREGKVYLAIAADGAVAGQTLARIETDDAGQRYGRFSMVYVDPAYRNQGIAARLIEEVESWFRKRAMPKIIYNTGEANRRVIELFHRRGYRITHAENEMVQMTKLLESGHAPESGLQ